MINILRTIIIVTTLVSLVSCNQTKPHQPAIVEDAVKNNDWKAQFDQQLPLLGHRNWILVVDKAFPLQTAQGMEYINTNEKLLPVLQYVLGQIGKDTHVNPIIYNDKELGFITEQQAAGVTDFKTQSAKLFNGQSVQTLLHDSVFRKLDEASKLFKVLVIKTNEAIPYSSVFLQLDCKYWNGDKEQALRESMK